MKAHQLSYPILKYELRECFNNKTMRRCFLIIGNQFCLTVYRQTAVIQTDSGNKIAFPPAVVIAGLMLLQSKLVLLEY